MKFTHSFHNACIIFAKNVHKFFIPAPFMTPYSIQQDMRSTNIAMSLLFCLNIFLIHIINYFSSIQLCYYI